MIAGPVAYKIEGTPMSFSGNMMFNPKLGINGVTPTKEIQNTPLKQDVICFAKNGVFSNPQLHFSHSTKSKNGSVYKRVY